MLILGIDTSCDDTSSAVLRDGSALLSNIVSSQTSIHAKYGGIVPELASRKHIEMIWPVVDEALAQAGVRAGELDAIAVCCGPGLIGSLLVGCGFAKSVAYAKDVPLVAVNHLEGHLLSTFLEAEKPEFPFLSLVVSGGHTSIYLAEGFGRYTELGRTRDDAAGEAFDKVSKLLGLGYPGGPVIDRLAKEGDPRAFVFPRAYLPESYDFSFSGMKTAVRNMALKEGVRPQLPCDTHAEITPFMKDVAASFQASMIDVLVRKMQWAIDGTGVKSVTVSGGVAANGGLRDRMAEMASEKGVALHLPSRVFCTDNAAMIAIAGYHRFEAGERAGMELNPKAYLPL
jgi:N6-L-threonylcarbamoyladenine synthase